MTLVRCPVVEVRQYELRAGQRDVLIELFDREFVETQEAVGMMVLGQFRDVDNVDRFVWLRGFDDMPSRAEALMSFYNGPTWTAHAAEANATMVDSDNVLLLRPVGPQAGFPEARRPATDSDPADAALIVATLYYRDRPFDAAFADFFERRLRPVLAETGAEPLAWLQTEYAANTFPRLPVRTDVHAFVWFARFAGPDEHAEHERRLARTDAWPALTAMLTTPPLRLRLAPTRRSRLR